MVRVKTLLFILLFAGISQAQALGTAFTYQGELKHLGVPANGTFDFQFELFDSSMAGTSTASPVILDDVSVVEGVFTVQLDFGPVFSGDARWLEIQVRDGASTDVYTLLDPRQEITPAPYAINADLVDGLNAVDLVGAEGPQGPEGPAGTALAYARVAPDGTVTRDSGNITVTALGGGGYCIGVTGGTVQVAVASLDAIFNVGGYVQTGVFHSSSCTASGNTDIFVQTRDITQDGGSPGDNKGFYVIVN